MILIVFGIHIMKILNIFGRDEHYEEVRESMSDDSADSYDWRYYNDGLDMDQQDERFWNF